MIVSLGVHLAAGAALAFIPQQKLREVVAIALNEVPKEAPKQDKPEPPKPAPRPEPAARARAPRAAASPETQTSTSAASDPSAFRDLGLTLDSSSADGLAVNVAPQPSAAKAAPVRAVKPKVLVSHKAEPEPDVAAPKPRMISIVRPAYTEAARAARIEGRVVLKLTVNEEGEVTDARVLEGLGYGLDEAAIAAAKNLRFAAATQDGRAVVSKLVLAMRFSLGT